jgi:hypothetical protein
MSTGYRACRPEYLGTDAEAFDAKKAKKTQVGAVRIDMGGARRIIQAAIDLPPFDQGSLGSCEANAAIAGLMIVRPGTPMLSRRDLYLKALMRDGVFPRNNGTTGETIHAALAETGVCLESSCPYTDVDGEWQERPSIMALEEGWDNRLDATHRILLGSRLGADIRASIDVGRPVQDGGPCSEAYERFFDGFHKPEAFRTMLPSIGGHARLLVGSWLRPDGSYWYLERGSWGAGGADEEFPGHVWLHESCLHQFDEFFSYFAAPKA